MNIKIPEKINYILETFWQNGFEAYCVGGSIRDSVMGIPTGDWDITTSALPEETKKLFKTETILSASLIILQCNNSISSKSSRLLCL